MAREPKYGITINGWERLLAAFMANAADFPQLEPYREELEEMLEDVKEAATEQAALTAQKQEASKRVRSLLKAGRKVATFLRLGARRRYGDSSEKLVEFGLKPFRGRPRPQEEEPVVEPPVGEPPPVVETAAPPASDATSTEAES
jgi:hypothetical protein